MAWTLESNWHPTQLMRIARSADTSTGATEVTTDAGRAYLKPMGNRQGPHVLATDWVGTHLAKWFGLSTFEIAILRVEAAAVFELPRGAKAEPGPAFVARADAGDAWGGGAMSLSLGRLGAFCVSGAAQAARFSDCNTGRLAPHRYKVSGIGRGGA